jgi:hypothetical protein
MISKYQTNQTNQMALYSQATDLSTRQTVWITQSRQQDRPQLNSHQGGHLTNTANSMAAAGIDGLSAAEIAYLCTSYEGWQHTSNRYWCNPEVKSISFSIGGGA